MGRATRLNLIMRSHFNNYYYVSGDFKNGFLFALGGAHKQNKLSEINNENMNGLFRLAQPGSRASGALELKAQAPRARAALPRKGRPTRWRDSAQRQACPRPPLAHHPAHPARLLLKPEASPSALTGERSSRRNGVPTSRPSAELQCVPEAARAAGWGVSLPRGLGRQSLLISQGMAARPGEQQVSAEPGPSWGLLGRFPGRAETGEVGY